MSRHENAPVPAEGHTGRDCLSGQAGTPQIAQLTERRQSQDWRIDLPTGEERIVTLSGRPAWLLTQLAEVGARGVTARDLPAGLRISGFVHRLRLAGVPIETETESHGGPFPGHHARYRLGCRADRIGAAA
jgi:hypothetical protein